MKCNVCGQDKSGIFCTCGYCQKCIDEFGHDKCFEIEQERRRQKDEE